VFNFNKKGDTYKTSIGGFISLILKLAIIAFTVYKTYLLIMVEDNSYAQREYETDFDAVGAQSMKSMNLVPFFRMISTKTWQPITLDDEFITKFARFAWF